MTETFLKTVDSKWRNSWRRYAEFLRKNGRRPEYKHTKERSLYVWYSSNLSKLDNGLLDKELEPSFLKLTDDGDTYKFYVVDREKSVPRLALFGREASLFGNEVENEGKVGFSDACKMYVDFCNRMERPPLMEIKEEMEIAKWFFKAKDDFTNSGLTDKEMSAFDMLLQSTKQYKNENVINHESILPKEVSSEDDSNIVLNADNGTKFHVGAWERRWFEMRDRYSRYLDDNKKVPTDNSDLQLYQWLLRQRKLLASDSLKESRKAELEKLLLKIDDIRRNYPQKPNGGGRKRKKPTGDVIESSSLSKSKHNHVKQDDLWNQKWQAYKDFMSKNKRRPSKHRAEDMVLFDWFKHSKKLLKRGQMKADRIEKFKQLLSKANNLPHKNNYRYSDVGMYVKPNRIHLYDYQEEMLSRVETKFHRHRSLMVQMPTGTGKTYLLVAVVSDFIRNIGGHVWIVTHRRELVQQVKATIRKFKALVDDATDIEKHATVYSIQWLTRHYGEVEEKPGMIIIDEAHHAVAKTYSSVINAFPLSKILGLTATPCRLNAQPFTDLFEELLQSWTIGEFIAKKYLSLYDYMSVRPSSADIRIINGLNRRGVDGDFSVREMAEKLDIRPSLQRLCDTVLRYAKNKKGIVYAINIQHAEHIAEFYCENGIKAEAVSNKTPARKRNDILKRFKETPIDGSRPLRDEDIQVIVNVQLFDEGWDVPDAEFIQLARPTLSLSKYLQMVGRGLRVYGGKKFCIILDNVGSYRLFGLPSDERDWERMFEGKLAGKGMFDENSLSDQFDNHDYVEEASDDSDTDMMMLLDHSGLRGDLNENFGYKIVKGRKGLYGVVDKDGNEVIPCEHGKITLRPNAIAQLFDKDGSETDYSWIDLISGVRFRYEPSVTRKDSLELTTRDNFKFYPRVKSKWMNSEAYTLREILDCGIDDGLRFRNFYIQPSEPRKLYKYVGRIDDKTLYVDEDENYFVRTDYEQPLKKTTLEEWKEDKQSRKDELSATGLDDGGEWYWNLASDYRKNGGETVKIGFLEFTEKEGGYQYNYDTSQISFRRDEFIVPHLIRRQIRMRECICFLGDNYIVTKSRPHVLFHIYQRYIDGRRFDVEFYAYLSMRYYCRRLYYDGKNPPIVGNSEIRNASDIERERSDKRWKKLREEMQ